MDLEERNKKEKLIFCENVRYLMRKYNLSRTAMCKKMGVSMKTLKSIENDVIPGRMSCEVFVRIYVNFEIGSQYMLFCSLEERDKEKEMLKKQLYGDKIK